MLGGATGAVAGLATVTPASGFVTPAASIVIGILAATVCYFFVVNIKNKFSYDDSLDAFGVHGVGGVIGILATGLFATKMINPAGNDGLFYGNASLLVTQAVAVLVVVAYSVTMTFVILKAVEFLVGLKVSDKEEVMGLDITQHEESAYTVID
jgi:Amt family ammonium transporter